MEFGQRNLSKFVIFVIFAGLASASSAAVLPPGKGVGLVLGGGGARGFAHLGVLKELQRLRIPVSCIAGTSAGALIGGIYANGVNVDEIEREFDAADWEKLLAGKPERADVPYDRKRDDYKNYLDVNFGIQRDGLRVPRSAINSGKIELFLHQLTRDRSLDDFDHLPIPFRAVATDLASGDAVVFNKGPLARALRASMAVPGVFDLVEDDGRLLVDGMLARNVPVEDVKGRCAERVIVVDVSAPLLQAGEIKSLFDVLDQTSSLMVKRNVAEQMKLVDGGDVVIRPELNGYGASSFTEHKAIVDQGEAAAKAMDSSLRQFSVSAEEYQAWRDSLQAPKAPRVEEVRVEGVGKDAPRRADELQRELAVAGVSEPVSRLRGQLYDLYASGDYDRLAYHVEDDSGRNVATVTPIARSVGAHTLRFGLNLQSATPGDSHFNVLASEQSDWLNSAGGSWRNDASVGQNKSIRSEFYQPLWRGSPVFAAASLSYKEELTPFYDSNHVKFLELNRSRSYANLDAGIALGKYGEARIGVYSGREHINVSLGDSSWLDSDASHFRDIGVRASMVVDQFDNPRWPRSGYFLSGNLNTSMPAWGSDVDTENYETVAEGAYTWRNFTFRLTGKMRGNVNQDSNDPRFYGLGGFLNVSGYQPDELTGSRVALARLMMYWRAASLPPVLGSGVYAGVSLEAGHAWNNIFSFTTYDGWIPAASVFLGADTILGPTFIGVGHGRGGRLTGYLYLGVDY